MPALLRDDQSAIRRQSGNRLVFTSMLRFECLAVGAGLLRRTASEHGEGYVAVRTRGRRALGAKTGEFLRLIRIVGLRPVLWKTGDRGSWLLDDFMERDSSPPGLDPFSVT